MRSDEKFVFDTYALLEIINGNSRYKNYLDAGIIITEFILAELCFRFIREGESAKSDDPGSRELLTGARHFPL